MPDMRIAFREDVLLQHHELLDNLWMFDLSLGPVLDDVHQHSRDIMFEFSPAMSVQNPSSTTHKTPWRWSPDNVLQNLHFRANTHSAAAARYD